MVLADLHLESENRSMKMQMSNQMRMEQRMKLAPRMIQSMEVLQLPLMALQEKIEAELNSNPVLEQAEEGDEETTGPETNAGRILRRRDHRTEGTAGPRKPG